MGSGDSDEVKSTKLTNEANKEITQSTNQTNYQIAQDNLALQREQQEYEKQRDQLTMQREDTALQRKVADGRAAGLSSLASIGATGSSASVAPTITTPQLDYKADKWTAQKPNTPTQMDKISMITGILGSINQAANTVNQLYNGDSSRQLQAQQLATMQQAYAFAQSSQPLQLEAMQLANAGAMYQNQGQIYNNKLRKFQAANEYGKASDYANFRYQYEKYGIRPNDSSEERMKKKIMSFVFGNESRKRVWNADGVDIPFFTDREFNRDVLNAFAKDWLGIDVDDYQKRGTDWLQETTRNTLGKALKGLIDGAAKTIPDLFNSDSSGKKKFKFLPDIDDALNRIEQKKQRW